MKLSDVWFTALSENESGQMMTVYGRDEYDVEWFCHFNFLSCVNKWANTDDITSYYSTFWTLKKPD